MRWTRKDSNLTWWCNQSVIMLRMVVPEDSSIYPRYHLVSFSFAPSISWSLVFFTCTGKSSSTSPLPPPPRCIVYDFTKHPWVLNPWEYFLFKRLCYTLLFRELQLYRFVSQDSIWFSKYPSFPGVFLSSRKKPWERGCKVLSPWIVSTLSLGRFPPPPKAGKSALGTRLE